MNGIRALRLGMMIFAVGFLPLLTLQVPAAPKNKPPDPIRFGLMSSLFPDVPKPSLEGVLKPFQTLLETETGLRGQVVAEEDAEILGRRLAKEEVHLGILHGVEFAWARQRYPALKPLLVALNDPRQQQACLIVRQESAVTSLADLQGNALALSRHGRAHCRLLVERHCQGCGWLIESYFSSMTTPSNQEDALDDVVDGIVQATIVDGRAFDSFRERKPGRWGKLKVVQESKPFPVMVVAYKPTVLDAVTLQRVCTGLLKSNQTRHGLNLLSFAGINGFKNVPKDYDVTLTKIIKLYPPPTKKDK